MTPEELQSIIDKFDEQDLKERAIFGIFQYGGGSDESFIKASKEGFELFALQLLKASKETERILADPSESSIPIDHDEEWIDEDSDTFVQYLEPVAKRLIKKEKTESNLTIADKLIPIGCAGLFILLFIAAIVGLVKIFNWFSDLWLNS